MATNPAPLQAGEVVRIRDERWRIVRRTTYALSTAIEAAGCDAGNRSGRATFLLPFETIERFQAHPVPRVVGRRRWRRAARRTLATASPSLTSLRAAAPARLRIMSFQLEPVLALVRGEGCRFLIADAVGLGKTVQAGLMIAETLARRPEGRTLVVTPAALREQWREEIESRFGLGADILDAAGIARLTSQLPAGINPWSVRQVVITSIDYIKRPEVMRSIEALIWDLVVFDEAHNLAGRSDRSAAAGAIGNRARALVLLTATPHSGDDQAFDRLVRLGHLGRVRSSPGVQAHATRCRSPSQQTRHVAACPADDRRSRDAPRTHGVREAGVEPIERCCRRRRPTRDVGARTTRLQQRRLACALGRTEVGAVGDPARCRTFSRVSRSLTT